MKEEDPKAELIKQIVAANKAMNKKYNHLVDTNLRL